MESLTSDEPLLQTVKTPENSGKFSVLVNPPANCYEELDDFIRSQPGGNFFQSSSCYSFYKSMKAYEPVWLCAYDRENRPVGAVLCIINRLMYGLNISWLTRAIVTGGPVVKEDLQARQEVMQMLIRELIRIVRDKSVYLEFRNSRDMSVYKEIFLRHHFRFNDHLNFIIDTSDAHSVTRRMSKTKLQQIRKSRAAGAEVILASDISQIREFYSILTDLYKNRAKKPLPPFGFFQTFFNRRGNFGEFILVRYQGRIVGGAMCIVYGKKMICEWYKCGMDRVFKGVYPSTLASWAAIEYAVNNQVASFDFMGAGKPSQPYGVRDFKAQFGGELVNFGRYVLTLHPGKFELSQKLLKATGHLK